MNPQELVLHVQGDTIYFAYDSIRRYCGLPWRDGPPDTWAWTYYDELPVGDANLIGPTDVSAAAALHPKITDHDQGAFIEHADRLGRWLETVPVDASLRDADRVLLSRLSALAGMGPDLPLDLLTKVLHRKRPNLIPLFTPSNATWFRLDDERPEQERWDKLVLELKADLTFDANHDTLTAWSTQLPHAYRRVRRYVGLTPNELPAERAWTYPHVEPTGDPNVVEPLDVVAAASTSGSPLSQADLAAYVDHRDRIGWWLAAVPVDATLRDADDALVEHLRLLAHLHHDLRLGLLWATEIQRDLGWPDHSQRQVTSLHLFEIAIVTQPHRPMRWSGARVL